MSKKAKTKPAASNGETQSAPEPFKNPQDIPIVEVCDFEIKNIITSAGTQPRVTLDEEHAAEIAEVIKESIKAELPNPFDFLPDADLPVLFRTPEGKHYIADGFHRLIAHKAAHLKVMKVAIRNGTERDALLYSVGTNEKHGLKRTQKDKQRAVKILLNDSEWSQWSDSDIARAARVSSKMVGYSRTAAKSPTVRKYKTSSGKVATMDTSAIGKGKGGGKKGKKDENGKAKPSKSAEDEAKDLDKALCRIADSVGGEEGGKIRRGVLDEKKEYEHLTKKDVLEWAGFAPAKIKEVAPLVIGEGWKPARSFDFIGSELTEKTAEELRLRCLAGGGEYITEYSGFAIVVNKIKK